MHYEKLFEKGTIGRLELRNRVVMTAMGTMLGDWNGCSTPEQVRFYEERAKGGCGLIIPEFTSVDPDSGHCNRIQLGIWDARQISSFERICDAVHRHGAKIFVQLHHGGREAPPAINGGRQAMAPSVELNSVVGRDTILPREMTIEDIDRLVGLFIQAALNAQAAGADGVEIHGAHGYLINQFMSTFSNKRTDEYGGTLENRMRFALEVVDAVRAAVGPDYPVLFRFNTCDYVEGGIELPEAIVMAKMLEEAGVDALHCTQGMFASKQAIIAPGFIPVMHYAENAAAIKRSVKIPVLAVGRYNDIYMSEAMLRDEKADFIVMARASLADPELPNKAKAGKTEEIIHCIGCNQGCTGETAVGNRVNCIANPHTCRETEYDLSIVAEPKKVFVAGAGVAGLAAAYGAAERGHNVTVFEASDEIGGQWLSAMTPPGKSEYASLILNYRNQLKKYGAQIRLETPLTREIVEAEKPDAVILATGGTPMFLPIPGLDNREFVKTAIEVLRGRTLYGKRVVVAGGGMTGAETAVFLAVQGCDVTMIEMAPDIITDAVAQPRACLLEHIRKYNVKVHTHTKLTKVGEGTVYAEEYGEPITFKHIDMLVNAMGVRSYNPLQEQLEGLDCKVVVVGDASSTKNGYKNIREGFNAGNAI